MLTTRYNAKIDIVNYIFIHSTLLVSHYTNEMSHIIDVSLYNIVLTLLCLANEL